MARLVFACVTPGARHCSLFPAAMSFPDSVEQARKKSIKHRPSLFADTSRQLARANIHFAVANGSIRERVVRPLSGPISRATPEQRCDVIDAGAAARHYRSLALVSRASIGARPPSRFLEVGANSGAERAVSRAPGVVRVCVHVLVTEGADSRHR